MRHSAKMNPIQASRKNNEKMVCSVLSDKIQKQRPKYKLGDLIQSADI